MITHIGEKIDCVINAINIVLSEIGHLLSVDDIGLLNQCLLELEGIRQEVSETNQPEALLLEKLVSVIKLLDLFFGTTNNIWQYFNS